MTATPAYWLGCAEHLSRGCPACRKPTLRPERPGEASDLTCPCGERVPVETVEAFGQTVLERKAADAAPEAGRRRAPRRHHGEHPGPFHAKGSDTSEAAARSILDGHANLQLRVLDYVTRRAATGATCDEVETGLGLRHQTAAARLRELELAERVRKTEQRRKTRSGRAATVYRAVEVRGQLGLFGEAA